jgi:Sigma-70, region 4
MASLEDLPPDQRAVLDLVLRRGRSYDEIAGLLSIDRAGVRQRALAAFDALGPQTRVPAQRRALIADYLLGALPASVAAEVRDHLAQSASERAWARAVSSELQGMAASPLPEIPSQADTAAAAEPAAPAAAAAAKPAPAAVAASARSTAAETEPTAAARTAEASPAAAEPEPGGAAPGAAGNGDGAPRGGRPSSRRGGVIVLAASAAVVVAVVLVLLLTGGKSEHKAQTTRAARPATTSKSSSAARIVAQINMKPPSGGNSPVGVAEVLSAQGQFGVAIAAQGLAANTKRPPTAYAVWLYNSPADSKILGFVNPAVGKNGQLKTAGGLPSNASHYQKLLVTLERTSTPKTPGQIVLEGNLTGL